MPEDFKKDVREEFIEALIQFSEEKMSKEEANYIADKRLKCEFFYGDSPLGHKGPRWLANMIAKEMGYTKYPNS